MNDDATQPWQTAPYDDRTPADLADPTPDTTAEMVAKASEDEPGMEFHFYIDAETGECIECVPTHAIGPSSVMDAPTDADIYEVTVEANDDLGPDGLAGRIERAKESHLRFANDEVATASGAGGDVP